MSTELRIVVSLALLVAAAKCDFFTVPRSQIIYEGDRTTLICHVQGNAFWQVNGTIYSELNAAFFESRGITTFDFFLRDSELNKTLTVLGSQLNNNTVINCISVQQNTVSNTSENATITVLGLPSNVTRSKLNSTSIEVTWSESFVPPTITIDRYSITAFNTSQPDNHRQIDMITAIGPPISNGLYSHVFNFDQELTQCTQITFSVTSTSTIGVSPPSNVSWELPLYNIGNGNAEFKDSLSCSASPDTKTLTVLFKPHKLCAFQTADYIVSITKNGGSVASTSGSFSGNQQQATIQYSFTDLNVRLEHTAHIKVTSLYGNEQASVKCYLKETPSLPGISGLNNAPESQSGVLSGDFIAGVTISSIVVLLAIVLIIVLLIVWIRQPVYTKLNYKAEHTIN